jgi:serine/threonine protein kinase
LSLKKLLILILDGMTYLHIDKNISHRDIKLENILIFDNFTAKICDFGYAKILKGEDVIE